MPRDKVKINVKEKLEENVLDLSLCEISEVPVKDIAALKRATTIDLSNNKIVFLPKNFGTITQIVKLDLSKNEIKFLPESFGDLKNLKHLDLYNNKLEHLPLSFGNLSKLRYLDLKSNPLNEVLLKVVGHCLSSKECADAAKRVIPFMAELEREVTAEKKKKQEEEERLRAEEEKRMKEEEKVAKKRQAKKEKQNRDKLKKREAENSNKTDQNGIEESKKENGNIKHAIEEIDPTNKPQRSFFGLIKFLVLFTIFLACLFFISMRFFPEKSEMILDLIPIQQQIVIKGFYKNCELLIANYFDKVLNFYKF